MASWDLIDCMWYSRRRGVENERNSNRDVCHLTCCAVVLGENGLELPVIVAKGVKHGHRGYHGNVGMYIHFNEASKVREMLSDLLYPWL
jgi:hypothetical protein